jgi:transcriptional regulator with XRE-family HTH domain
VGKPQRELDPVRDELRELRKALGERIRALRKSKGWSQEEFSDHARIHRTFAGSLERGEKNASFHALVMIARCFGVTLAELLAGPETADSTGSSALPQSRSEKNRRGHDSFDRKRVLQEAMALERTAKTLREVASLHGQRKAAPKRTRKPAT